MSASKLASEVECHTNCEGRWGTNCIIHWEDESKVIKSFEHIMDLAAAADHYEFMKKRIVAGIDLWDRNWEAIVFDTAGSKDIYLIKSEIFSQGFREYHCPKHGVERVWFSKCKC